MIPDVEVRKGDQCQDKCCYAQSRIHDRQFKVVSTDDHLQNFFDDSYSETDINEPEIAVQDAGVKYLNEDTVVLRQIETELTCGKVKKSKENNNENNAYDWLGAFIRPRNSLAISSRCFSGKCRVTA